MEIDLDLFRKLVVVGVLDERGAKNVSEERGRAKLDQETTSILENGVIIARYLEHVVGVMEQEKVDTGDFDLNKLSQIKAGNTPATKLFNWNLILKEAAKLGIEVDSDSKGLIIAGDLDMINELLIKVDKLEESVSNPDGKGADGAREGKGEKKGGRKKKVKEGVDILSMDPNRKPTKCDSSLEIILNTLCRNFKMKPKQCAALLTNSNQYLMHSVVKGLKGNFEPVISWFQELYGVSEYFSEIICLESKKHKKHATLNMALNVVKTGCFSHNFEVAQW